MTSQPPLRWSISIGSRATPNGWRTRRSGSASACGPTSRPTSASRPPASRPTSTSAVSPSPPWPRPRPLRPAVSATSPMRCRSRRRRSAEAADLHAEIDTLNLLVDHPDTMRAIEELAASRSIALPVYLEIDCGGGRSGVDPDERHRAAPGAPARRLGDASTSAVC